MAKYSITERNITLSGDPETFAYSVSVGTALWTMTERPWVRFTDGTVLPFPAPSSHRLSRVGVSTASCAKYSDFGSHSKKICTRAEL